jgi:hypothetical protein
LAIKRLVSRYMGAVIKDKPACLIRKRYHITLCTGPDDKMGDISFALVLKKVSCFSTCWKAGHIARAYLRCCRALMNGQVARNHKNEFVLLRVPVLQRRARTGRQCFGECAELR